MRSLIIFVCFLSLQSIFATNLEKDEKPDYLDSGNNSSVPVIVLPLSTTEDSLRPCPPDKSLHTKEDIKVLIDYRVKSLSIYDSINNSYYYQAVAIRDKHANDFIKFREWYQKRPVHLKHNIEDIAVVRGLIEPFVKRISHAVAMYPDLQKTYDEMLNRTNKLFRKFNRYKIICENNCETNNPSFRVSKKSDSNTYYCSSLEELDQRITLELTQSINKIASIMLDRVSYDDQVFTKRFDELKNMLKDFALKQFGGTLYDILNLQDEYHHYIQDLIQINADFEVHEIKRMNLHINTKLLEFEERVEYYGSYCRTCNEIRLRSSFKKPNRQETDVLFHSWESNTNDVVDDVLNLKYAEIQNTTNNEYDNIFKELNVLLNTTDAQKIYLSNLKPIQDEVYELLETQTNKFNELKHIVAPSSVAKLIRLYSDSQQLMSNISKESDNLNQIWSNSEL